MTGAAPPGYGVDDGAGLLFAGTERVEAVRARDSAGVWHVDDSGDETPVETTLLSGEPDATPLSIAEFREERAHAAGLGD